MDRLAPSRRQERVARVIRASVSDTIANHLSDPRISGIVSVTEVDVSPDMRNADVHLSILAASGKAKRRTFEAIQHATLRIQSLLGKKVTARCCPHLHFFEDEKLKKTLETLNIIETISRELHQKDADIPQQDD